VRPTGACPDLGRQQQQVAFADRIIDTGVLQLSVAREAYQYARRSDFANDKRNCSSNSRDAEVIAVDEILA
jgi:hypothetical protein